MTDSDVLMMGEGYVHMIDPEAGPCSYCCPHIIVFASGVVLFRTQLGALMSTSDASVTMTDPSWSLLDDIIEAGTNPAPSPNCDRCGDDPAVRAMMNPPVCPKCGKA